MVIDERHRHELHEAARHALGDDAAVTLMKMLPPTGWADVATKHDLDALRLEWRADLRAIEVRMANLETRVAKELSTLTWRMAGGALVMLGTVAALVRL